MSVDERFNVLLHYAITLDLINLNHYHPLMEVALRPYCLPAYKYHLINGRQKAEGRRQEAGTCLYISIH